MHRFFVQRGWVTVFLAVHVENWLLSGVKHVSRESWRLEFGCVLLLKLEIALGDLIFVKVGGLIFVYWFLLFLTLSWVSFILYFDQILRRWSSIKFNMPRCIIIDIESVLDSIKPTIYIFINCSILIDLFFWLQTRFGKSDFFFNKRNTTPLRLSAEFSVVLLAWILALLRMLTTFQTIGPWILIVKFHTDILWGWIQTIILSTPWNHSLLIELILVFSFLIFCIVDIVFDNIDVVYFANAHIVWRV